MPYNDSYEAHRSRLRARQRDQRLAEKYREDLWAKPSKPRPSAAEQIYSSKAARLLPDATRGPVSRLGNVAQGWWGKTMSKAEVQRLRGKR
jgi:hypothetical protein